MVANGKTFHSEGRCANVRLDLQGTPITTDFLLLPLASYDAVLGALWLSTLGPIIWDFHKFQMEFDLQGQRCTLNSEQHVELSILHDVHPNPTRCFLFQIHITPHDTQTTIPPNQVQNLLDQYHDVFTLPKGLLPSHSEDRKIPLVTNTPVNVHPYRYAHF
ncbi:hypothetical protein CFOL_v3_24452 [Cephalotus follicularis]|uniref:RVP_2 domain-containing protein n=1 Tax=Cephalotus follicularis TaxID=3775 RepID=A0A1Q3CLL9_CEPFO|nr:hypothetical protein CFOL_v3_24452 [Cephalotus follicularis]